MGIPMGTTKHSETALSWFRPGGIHRCCLRGARANLQPVLITGMEKGGQLTTTTEVETAPAIQTI